MSPLIAWPLRARLMAALALGVVAALGNAPFGAWPAMVAAFAALPFLLGALGTVRQGVWTGWLFGLGYFALSLSWIVEPFLVDIARHGWMAPFALLMMAGGLALFWALAFGLAVWLGRTLSVRVLALVLIWTLAEFLRAHLFTGFPWAAPGQVWVGTNAAQLLAWIGPHGLDLATFAGAIPLGMIWLPASGQRARLAGLTPALLLVVSVGLVGAQIPEAKLTGKTVRLVQPNAPQHQKWDPVMIPVFNERMIEATEQAPRPDLIVWPEAALANSVAGVDDPLAELAKAANGVPVAFGVLRPEAIGFYNSLVYIDGQGHISAIYDKHHLVPFGEFLPFGATLERFGFSALASVVPQGMLAGPGPALMDFGDLGTALPLICYEAVFARDVSRVSERPDFLIQITNDAWFGEWSGPYQHLAQARMRAIEQGLPMIRVANTGVSAMIDSRGRIVAQLPLGQAGHVDAPLPAPGAVTFYARSGDWPLIAVVFVLFLGLCGQILARNGRLRD